MMAEKILIIDDEELLRVTLRAFFEDIGYHVVDAANGSQGLRVFDREYPDIVFTDLRMPEMDGLTLIAAIRERKPGIPVVVISGAGTLNDAIEAVRTGAWDYVTKPIRNLDELDIVARRALERAALLRDNEAYRNRLEELVQQKTADLRDSEARYRTLFESASDAIVLTLDGIIVTCNRKAAELFARDPREICGRTLLSLSPSHQPDGEASAVKQERLSHLALQGTPQYYEWHYQREYGDLFDAEITLSRLELQGRHYLQAIIRDVSDRKRKDALLLKLSTAVAQSANMVVITDPGGTIEYINPRFTEITGYSAAEVLGGSPRLLQSGYHPAAFYEDLWGTITGGRVWRGELHNRKKDGELYWESATIAPVRDAIGKVTGYIAIKEDITERKQYEERLYRQANYDVLTGLPNRYLLAETIKRLLERVQAGVGTLYLVLLDVDNFKHVNDTLGHFLGDELLQQLAGRLADLASGDDIAARFVGDEFVMVLSGAGADRGALAFAEKLRARLAAPFHIAHTELFVSACIGIVSFPTGGDGVESLLRNAEAAMFRAKKQGRGSIRFFTSEMTDRANERFSLSTRLHKALERDEFSLYFQPQVGLEDMSLKSAEALLRWHPAPGETVMPTIFVPILEDTGLIIPVGEWVIRSACRQLREWLDRGLPPFQVAVNISVWQFQDGRLVETVRSGLEEFRLEPELLCLEFTESMVMHDVEETIRTLSSLIELGVTLSIDDFGTGYSSLSYLTRMPIHEVKIDKSFVKKVPHDINCNAIVSTILGMAACLNLRVVAEGVETEEQLRYLAAQKCGRVQGYYFSQPLPPEEFAAFIARWQGGGTDDREESAHDSDHRR
jgi:diguanylate cyclase (GGDEF)-like protein/PAS domain S-box-containing protein